MTGLAIPRALEPFAGRIVDIDTHEMVPAQLWGREFGAVTEPLARAFEGVAEHAGTPSVPGYPGDVVEINAHTVWAVKGPRAPGATDISRRTAVMDLMGVSRQLMYPSGVGILGSFLLSNADDPNFLAALQGDRRAYAFSLFEAHNAWAVRMARLSPRIRPVAALYGSSPEDLLARAKRLVESGIRVVWLLASTPPGGMSPAHSDLDPLWKLLTDHDVTATLHIGSEGRFLRTDVWGDAPAFDGYKVNAEFDLSPWRLSTSYLPCQNFLATMVLGGVFERHPALRFGVVEVGAYWIGPLAATLDLWHDNNQTFGKNQVVRLSARPSDFIRRNVRVTPYSFEPVDTHLERYGLEEVYCYGSDFPHLEGGKDPMVRFASGLERFGPEMLEKFFVTNGAYLFPAA
jgi:predicted TIM-barrel fold metal-dependent hydrolase